jgi:hypothetical protein
MAWLQQSHLMILTWILLHILGCLTSHHHQQLSPFPFLSLPSHNLSPDLLLPRNETVTINEG